jgi:hypothetical protein
VTDARTDWKNELRPTPDCIAIERLGEILTPHEREHLAHCARCQAEMALWNEFDENEVRAEDEDDVQAIVRQLRHENAAGASNVVPISSRRAMWPRAFAIAASLVIVVAVGYVMQNREPSVNVPIGESATPIAANLWAEQIDAQNRLENNWREIQDYFVQLMNWAGVETIQAEELSVLPGLDEIFALIDVKTHVEGGRYDLLVVDCAPTAETLRLLSLPEIMSWYIERIFPVERKVVKTLRPIVTRMTTLPIAGERFYSAVERLHRNLAAVHAILTDRSGACSEDPSAEGEALAGKAAYLALLGNRIGASLGAGEVRAVSTRRAGDQLLVLEDGSRALAARVEPSRPLAAVEAALAPLLAPAR